MTDIPLFPLHAVLCPGIALPLHVFEPRYRALTEHCLATGAPFGVVLIRDGREVGPSDLTLAGIGTFAEIREANRHPDGRFDLLVVGVGRFAIEEVDATREPYLVGSVIPLDDDVGDEARAGRLADRLLRRFVTYLRLLQPLEGETSEPIDVRIEVETEPAASTDEPHEAAEDAEDDELATGAGTAAERRANLVIPDDPTTLSYLLSGIVQVDLATRQRLLEADTTEQRLELLGGVLDRELWALGRRLRLFIPEGRIDDVRLN
jgi:Lon protease-like protein